MESPQSIVFFFFFIYLIFFFFCQLKEEKIAHHIAFLLSVAETNLFLLHGLTVNVYGSFQPNSNRGVHPMSWIFFLLSMLVDIIETKKFCEFEISTPFRFRVAAIRNIGGVGTKSESRNERPPKRGRIFQIKPPKTMKIIILSCFLL